MIKKLAKALGAGVALALILPALLAYRIGSALVGRNIAFVSWSQTLSLLPGISGNYLRRAFYRRCLAECGADACIGFGTTFSQPSASVHRGVYIGSHCSLGLVTLEDDVLVSSHVSILSGARQHGTQRLDVPIRRQPGTVRRVTIGKDSWIGERAIVMADVGEHCVVGAGAVVTRPIPDFAIAVGVPAAVIGYRDQPNRAQVYSSVE